MILQLLPPSQDLPGGAFCSPATSLPRLHAANGPLLAVVCSDHDRACFNDLDPQRVTWLQGPANLTHGEAAQATVAFAVELEGALDIVVCGHLDCPSLEHILAADRADLPGAWREVGETLRDPVLARYAPMPAGEERLVIAAEHALAQTQALARQPCVKRAIHERGLRLHTWLHCEAPTEALYVYEPFTGQFTAATPAVTA